MSVRRAKNGRWRFRVVIDLHDGTKKRISGTVPHHNNTKEAAKQAERDAIARAQRGDAAPSPAPAPKPEVNFNTFADEFMKTYAKTNNKPSEQKNKDLILKRHLRGAFGHLNLGDIRAREIEGLKAELLDGRRGRKTVNNVLAVLGKMLRYAHEIEVLDRVPRIRLLKCDKQKFRFLDFEELDALLAAAKPELDWYVAILLGADAGLRLGEIRALRWEDVDLKNGRITVGRALWQNEEGTTKGWNLRTIPLTKRLENALKELRRARLGKYVLADADGLPFNLEIMRWNLPRLCRKAQFSTAAGWHSLRHTFCSHLALRGAPSRVIQELAGHSSLSTTLRYMHLVPGATDDAIALLNDRRGNGVATGMGFSDPMPNTSAISSS
jgi:integrase